MNLFAFRKAANLAGTAVFAVEVWIIDYLGINKIRATILSPNQLRNTLSTLYERQIFQTKPKNH